MTSVATAEVTTRAALARLLRTVPSLRQGLLPTLALAVVGTALQVAIPIVVQQVVDEELIGASDLDLAGIAGKGAIALAAMTVAMVARRWSTLRLATASARGLSDLRVLVFAHLHRLSALHVQAERRGALVARVTSDIYRIQDFMEWGGMGLLIGSSQVVLAVIAMLVYRWQLAVLVVVGVAMYGLLLVWFQRVLARAHDKVRERVADSMSAVGESISGLPVVRAYGAERPTMQRVHETVDAQFRQEFKTFTFGSALFSSAEVFAGLLTAGVVAAGILLGAAQGVSAGALLAFLFLVNLLVLPVQTLVETLDSAQAAAAGMRRVLGVLDTPVDIVEAHPTDPLPPGPLAVSAQSVRFRYPNGGDDVLVDVDVEIPAGCRVAIVGQTGSGKTTFAKLLARLLDPSMGSISIGGVPLRNVAFQALRQRVAFVPQEGFLFDTTVAANVRYGRPRATPEELAAAFEELGLSDWLDTLSGGLDTPVGERGAQLSAGERQLVALVRAWMTQPDLLILDEATSAVDPALEVRLRRTIDHLIEGRTSVTIAHRLSTAEAADLVLVFESGRLVERGSHSELLSAGGVYSGLHADWMAGTRI